MSFFSAPPNGSVADLPVIDRSEDLLATPLESIPLDLALPHPIYVKINGRFVLFRCKGDLLSTQRARQLSLREVDTVYILHRDWQELTRILEESIGRLATEALDVESNRKVTHLLYTYWRNVQEKRLIMPPVFEKVVLACNRLSTSVRKNTDLAQKLISRLPDPNQYIARHSINIAVYAVVIGVKKNLTEHQLRLLALGAMFANIGNIRVPPEILLKPGKLTPEEFARIKEHPDAGAQILEGLHAPPEIIEMVRSHHERVDGNGYNAGIPGRALSLLTKIVSIADVYDALTSARPWGKAHPPAEAIEILKSMHGYFDPEILSLVIKK